MTDITAPKFCTKGCGETLDAQLLTGEELETIRQMNPHFKNHWKIKCTKCGAENYLSEGMKTDEDLGL